MALKTLRDLPQKAWRDYWKIWGTAREEIGDVWADYWTFRTFVGSAFTGGPLALAGRKMLATIEILQEAQQDIGLLPARLASELATVAVPLPEALNDRVMTAENAVRMVIGTMLEESINVIDIDQPIQMEVAITAQKLPALNEVVNYLRSGATHAALTGSVVFVRKTVIGMAIFFAIDVAKLSLAAGVGYLAYRFYDRVGGEGGKKLIDRFALPQNSRRVHTDKRRRVRTRE